MKKILFFINITLGTIGTCFTISSAVNPNYTKNEFIAISLLTIYAIINSIALSDNIK